jgi:hypothetical protein
MNTFDLGIPSSEVQSDSVRDVKHEILFDLLPHIGIQIGILLKL